MKQSERAIMKRRVGILICLHALVFAVSAHADPNQPEVTLQGVLQLPEGMSLQVISVHGGEFSVVPENGQATMPLGDYIVRHWVFEKTDTEGKVWKIQAYPPSSIRFKITDLPASLQIIPEPINTTLTVGGSSVYSFSQTLKGPAGETLYLYCDSERIPPKVEITNQAKNFSVTVTGTYG
jgi:hypothetical protein